MSWRPFCIFLMVHSHSRNFTLIFFKFEYKALSCCPLFSIENQQIWLINFDVILKCVSKNIQKSCQKQNAQIQTSISKVSIDPNSNQQITH